MSFICVPGDSGFKAYIEMGSKTLHLRISVWISTSLFLGILLTAAVSWFPIYFNYPTKVDDLVSEMMGDEGFVIMDLSRLAANVARAMTQTPVYYLLLMRGFQERYLNGEVRLREEFDWQGSMVNGEKLALGLETPYGYNPSLNLSYQSSLWYQDPAHTEIQGLSSSTQSELRDSAVLDFLARPSVSYPGSAMTKAYHAYADSGLLYMSPAVNESYYVSFQSDGCPPYFDPRCRPWYQQVLRSDKKDWATLTKMYIFASSQMIGQTACIGRWGSRELESVSCIDFQLDTELFAIFQSQHSTLTYSYILTTEGGVYYHPYMNMSHLESIQELELATSSPAEISDFNTHILPLFSQGQHVLTSYYRNNGDKYLLAVSPINLILSQRLETGFPIVLGLTLSEKVFREGFQDLITESNRLLQIELIVFFCVTGPILIFVLLLSRSFAISIIKPINDLAEVLERMHEGDLEVNIKRSSGEFPGEIERLYAMFAKLKVVLKLNKGEGSDTDPAESLLNYAQGMKLFTEVHNSHGISICARNIGRIHFNAGRYEEGLAYFHQAYNIATEVRDTTSPSDAMRTVYEAAVLETQLTLATALLQVSEKTGKREWDQAIDLLFEIAKTYQKLEDWARYVSTLLDISMAYIQWGNLQFAKEQLLSASSLILKASDDWSVSPEILRERALFTEALLLYVEGRDYESACLFTDCVELNDRYDPRIHRLSLTYLRQILTSKALNCSQIDEFLLEFDIRNRDIVYVVDYSASMSGLRIHRVIGNLIRFFEKNMQNEDRISLLTVNRVARTAFDLIEKGTNTDFLKAQILKVNDPRGGTAMYDGIRQGLKQFPASTEEKRIESELLSGEIMEKTVRSKWLVAVFDGEDNCSHTNVQRVRKLLGSSGVNLVFIGLFLTAEGKEVAKSLCHATSKGLFLDCFSLSDIDTSFQALTHWMATPVSAPLSSSLFALNTA